MTSRFVAAPGRYDLKVSGWFYGIWLSLFLILVLLVLFLIFKKTTDKWWQQKGLTGTL